MERTTNPEAGRAGEVPAAGQPATADPRAEVLGKVIALAAEQVGVDPSQVVAETHFVNDLHFDSLDLVEFTMGLEDEFEVAVADKEAELLQTVGQVADYIVAHPAATARPPGAESQATSPASR